ncbi:MAG: hypothetical protein QF486_00195 [Candidatus Woesearchaeota archaeon]|jgi:hypothetical protein|nr:hypothetical protein [Candidatus Woesearchaeota archaeon]
MNKFTTFWLGNLAYAVGVVVLLGLLLFGWGLINTSLIVQPDSVDYLVKFFSKEIALTGDNADLVEAQVDFAQRVFVSWALSSAVYWVFALACLLSFTTVHRAWMWGKIQKKKFTKKRFLEVLRITGYRTLGWIGIFYLCYEFILDMNYIWPPLVIALCLWGSKAISGKPITAKIACLTVVGLIVALFLTSASLLLGILALWLPYPVMIAVWLTYVSLIQLQFT